VRPFTAAGARWRQGFKSLVERSQLAMLRASDVGRGEDATKLLSEENFRPLQVPRRARMRPRRAPSARRPPLSCRLVVALTGGAVGAPAPPHPSLPY